MKCTLHSTKDLIYFCQTCLDPICQQCCQLNPHSDEYHKILSLQQSISNRKIRFSMYIQSQINPLRQRSKQKIILLKQLEQKQLNHRNIIMKDILLEFQNIEQKTKEKTQLKKMEYQTQIKYYQNYLNVLDDLVYTFQKTMEDPYNLLILYQDFNKQLKNLQLKEIKQKLNFFQINQSKINQNYERQQYQEFQNQSVNQIERLVKQIPRQMKNTYQKLDTLDKLKTRNKFINSLIIKASENYKNQIKDLEKEVQFKHKQSLKVYNQMNHKLMTLNYCKSCVFCQLPFSIDLANDQCQQNKPKIEIANNYNNIQLPQNVRGTRRHYWVDSHMNNRKIPQLTAHILIRQNLKKDFKNSLKQLSIIKCCFNKYQIKTGQNFMKPFIKEDKDQKGYLSKISFKYILTKIYEMNQVHCDVLTYLLSYNWGEFSEVKQLSQSLEKKYQLKLEQRQFIDYKMLPKYLENCLFPLEQFNKIQEQLQKSKSIAPSSQQAKKFKYW